MALATLSLAGAALTHTARTVYLIVRDRRDDANGGARHNLSPEQMRELSEIVASAVGRVVAEQLASHGNREEHQMERLLAIETHESDRAARVESTLERLATIADMSNRHSSDQYESIMRRLDTVERALDRRAAA